MFEGLVAGLLNTYLGEFIENVSKDDLSAAVWSGEVSLTNLKVKTKALNFLQLPIDVIDGFIGRIFLKANWSALGSRPVEVAIENIFLIARPREDFDTEAKYALESAIRAKIRKLGSWQKLKLASPEMENSKGGGSWAEKLTTKIVNNLQVSIKNVHIRYEDPSLGSNSKETAACLGVCLSELTLYTTNSEWKKEFITDLQSKVLFKKLDMKGLGVYFNTNSNQLSKAKDLAYYFRSTAEFRHIAPPISGFVQLSHNTDNSPTLKEPKVKVDCGLDALGFSLSETQYQSMLKVLHVLSKTQSKISKIYDKIKFDEGSQKDKGTYIPLYKRTLNASWLDELNESEKKTMDKLERKLTFECLARYRVAAMAELRHQLKDGEDIMTREDMKAKQAKQKTLASSVGYYLGFGGTTEGPKVDEKELENKREQIYKEIDYSPEDELIAEQQRKARPKDYINVQLEFRMPKFFLELLTSKRKKIVYIIAEDSKIQATSYVAGLVSQIQLRSFTVQDHLTENSLYKNIVYQEADVDEKSSSSLLNVKLETPPLQGSADTKISLELMESTVVVNQILFSRLGEFFTAPQETTTSIELISGWSARQAKYLRDATTKTLSQSMETYSSLWVSLKVDAPAIIVPCDLLDANSMVLVIDFGQFTIRSDLQSKEAIQTVIEKVEKDGYSINSTIYDLETNLGQNEKKAAIASSSSSSVVGSEPQTQKILSPEEQAACYDKYIVDGAKFSMYLTNGGPEWRKCRAQDLLMEEAALKTVEKTQDPLPPLSSPSTVISPFDLKIQIHKTVAPDVSLLPRMRIEGELPVIDLAINPNKYKRLMEIVAALSRSVPSSKKKSKKRKPKPDEKQRASTSSQLSQDNSGLQGNILHASENQTYADLKHALGTLPQTDAEAKSLLDQAKESKDGVPMEVIKKWWKKRMARLESTTTLTVRFTIGKVRLTIAKDGDSIHSPTLGLVAADLNNLDFGTATRYFDSKTLIALSGFSIRDVGHPSSPGNKYVLTTEGHEANTGNEGSNFVVVSIDAIKPDSPVFEHHPCPSITTIRVGNLSLILEPERVCEIINFLKFDFVGSTEGAKEKSTTKDNSQKESGLGLKTILQATDVSGNIDALEEKDLYFLKKKMNLRMNLRTAPSVSGDLKTGILIEPGSVFKATERVEGEDGQVFLKVEEGGASGWAFMKHPRNGAQLVVPFKETKINREQETKSLLKLDFGQLSVKMLWKDQHIATAAIVGLRTSVTQFRFSRTVELMLSQVVIEDCTPMGRVYSKAVETLVVTHDGDAKERSLSPAGRQGRCLISALYKTYDPHEKEFPGYCTDLDLTFKGLRVTYTNRFIDEITSYFTTGAMARIGKRATSSDATTSAIGSSSAKRHPHPLVTIEEDKKAKADTKDSKTGRVDDDDRSLASTQVTAITRDNPPEQQGEPSSDPSKTFSRIRLNLADVELWVPESSTSTNKLTARIHSINVTNEILTGESKRLMTEYEQTITAFAQNRKFQRFSVNLSRFEIASSSSGVDTKVGGSKLMRLGPVAVTHDAFSVNTLHISGTSVDLGDVSLGMNQKHYQLIMSLLNNNLGESKTVVQVEKMTKVVDPDDDDDDLLSPGPVLSPSPQSQAGEYRFEDGSEAGSVASANTMTTMTTSNTRRTSTVPKNPNHVAKQNLSIVDVKMPNMKVELLFGGGHKKERPFLALEINDLFVNANKLSYRKRTSASYNVSCKELSLSDLSQGGMTDGREIKAAFRQILTVERAEGNMNPVQVSMAKGGGVDLLKLRKGGQVVIDPEAPTEIDVRLENVRFILQKALIDMNTFFVVPGQVIRDGWVLEERKGRRLFMSLGKIDTRTDKDSSKGASGAFSYKLDFALNVGGMPVASIYLENVKVKKPEESDKLVLKYDDGSTQTDYTFQFPSSQERDLWVDALSPCVREARKAKTNKTSKLMLEKIKNRAKNEKDTAALGTDDEESPDRSGNKKGGAPMIVRVCVRNPCVILARRPWEEKTDGLVLSWTLDVEYDSIPGKERGGTSTKAALEDVQIMHATMDTTNAFKWAAGTTPESSGLKVNSVPMVAPFSAWVRVQKFHDSLSSIMPPRAVEGKASKRDANSSSTKPLPATEGTLAVTPLVAQLRYNDYKLVTRVLDDLKKKLAGDADPSIDASEAKEGVKQDGEAKDKVEGVATENETHSMPEGKEGREVRTSGSVQGQIIRSDSNEALAFDDAIESAVTTRRNYETTRRSKKKTAGGKKDVATHFPPATWTITLEELSLTLINDAANFDVPIACFSLQKINVNTKAASHSLRALISADIKADYHNNKLSCWEPMIEPWSVKICYLKFKEPAIPSYYSFLPESMMLDASENLPLNERTFIQIFSDEALDMNLTAGMVTSVQQSVALLSSATSSSAQNDDRPQSPEQHAVASTTEAQSIHQAPYRLVNETEIPLEFFANNDHINKAILAPGGSTFFSFDKSLITSQAFLLIVGETPRIASSPLKVTRGFTEFKKMVDAQSSQIRLDIMASFPPPSVLTQASPRFLTLYDGSKLLGTTKVRTERHFPAWRNISFDSREVDVKSTLTIQCLDGGSLLGSVSIPISTLSKLADDHTLPLLDANGQKTGAYLKIPRFSTPESRSREKQELSFQQSFRTQVNEGSWVYFPGYDLTAPPQVERRDLAGNIAAMIRVAQQTETACFSANGALYRKESIDTLHHFDAQEPSMNFGLFVSLNTVLSNQRLKSSFEKSQTSVFELAPFLNAAGHVSLCPLLPQGTAKPSKWDLGKDGTFDGHVRPWEDVVAQGERLVSVKTDLVEDLSSKSWGSLFYTAEIRQGLKVIRVHSKHKLRNDTKVTVAIRIVVDGRTITPSTHPYYDQSSDGDNKNSGGEKMAWVVLKPNQVAHLPLLLMSNPKQAKYQFFVKPIIDGHQYDWSSQPIMFNRSEDEKKRTSYSTPKQVECKGRTDARSLFFNVDRKQLASGIESIRFLPIVVLKNLLPDSLNIEWGYRGIPIQKQLVGAGEDLPLLHLHPGHPFVMRLHLQSIASSPSKPSHLESINAFLVATQQQGSLDRRVFDVPMFDAQDREFQARVEILATALRVVIHVFAPVWFFDTTGLNLSVSEDKKKTCPRRHPDKKHVSPEAKTKSDKGEVVQHAEMLSFSSSSLTKLYLRAEEKSKSSAAPTLPVCPRSVNEGTVLDDIAHNLKRARAYTFGGGERLLYHYSRGSTSISSCVLLTTKAVAVIQSARLKLRILLSTIQRAETINGGPFHSAEVTITCKNGQRCSMAIWEDSAARFYEAMMTYLRNRSLSSNFFKSQIMASDWSVPFDSDAVGTEGRVSLKALHSTLKSRHKAQYEVGYSITFGSGAWRRTRIINFVPRYFIMNNTPYWIQIRQHGTSMGDDTCMIKPESNVPFHWPSQTNAKRMHFRCLPPREGHGLELEDGWSWSSNFPISKVADHKMRLRNIKSFESKCARVEIRQGGASLFVIVSLLDADSGSVLPYRVENRCTREAFHVRQSETGPGLLPGASSVVFRRHGWMNVQPYHNVPFAVDDVTKKSKFEIVLDFDHSDSHYPQKDRAQPVIMDLSDGKQKPKKIRVVPAWHDGKAYDIHVFVEHHGPVKVIVLAEETQDVEHINPYSLTPLGRDDLKALYRRQELLRDSMRRNSRILEKLEQDHKFAGVAGNVISRKRPTDIHPMSTALQLHVLGVKGITTKSLYCIIEFGNMKQKVLLNDNRQRRLVLPVTQARGTTELRISLMLSKPLWTDECLGIVECRLDDFRNHQPVRRSFPLKACERQASREDLMPWQTPPCSVSSKTSVRAALDLDIWWIPMEQGSLGQKIESQKLRIMHRQRVVDLLQPKIEISTRYNNYLNELRRKLKTKRIPAKEANLAAEEMVALGNVRFSIKLLDVTGKALETYNLLSEGTDVRLSCVVTVTATGQSTFSTICSGGKVVLKDWNDSLTFDLPRAFLAKAAAGDQRGRASVTFYLETPRKASAGAAALSLRNNSHYSKSVAVGMDLFKLGVANIQLSAVPVMEAGGWSKGLASNDVFRNEYFYDPGRAKSHSWENTNFRWLTVREKSRDEVCLLICCHRQEGDLLPERSDSSLALALPRLGLSLVDQKPTELLYLSINDALLLHCDSPSQTTTEICIGRVQLDNQQPGFSFPFILHPKPMSFGKKKPMLQIGINRSKDNPAMSDYTSPMGGNDSAPQIQAKHIPGSNEEIKMVIHPQTAERNTGENNMVFSYISFLLQEFELNIEENLYWTLLSYIEEFSSSQDLETGGGGGEQKSSKQWKQASFTTLSDTYNIPAANSQVLTVGLMHLQSIALKFSFEISPQVRQNGLLMDLPFDPTAVLMSVFGTALGSIEDMKLTFDSILMQNVHTSSSIMINSILRHYKNDLLAQWYKIVFGIAILGNPAGALENMADGVMSFFLEPAKGMVENPGILGFSTGVAKGSKALLETTISTTFGAASKVTGAVSKGLAVLSMDDEFIESNRQSNKSQPKHIGEGLLSGAKSIGMGVFGGISGIVMDPIKGAQKGGVGGFFKGTATGLLGVVAKPTAGVVNATSQTLKSVGNTATLVLSDKVEPLEKMRLPRYIPDNSGSLQRYSEDYSLGAFLLSEHRITEPLLSMTVTNDSPHKSMVALANESQPPGTITRYATPVLHPILGPADVKQIKKQQQSITESKHAIIITGKRVCIYYLSRGIDWKKSSDIKIDRIDKVSYGKAKGGKKWGVQLTQTNGNNVAIWCWDQKEAESVCRRLKFHLMQ